jgi:MFS transporter, ACS family, hexuronate transporter
MRQESGIPSEDSMPLNKVVGSYRWRICTLLFFATTINYIDRQVLSLVVTNDTFLNDVGLMGPDGKLNKELFGYLDAAFKGAYAMGFLVMGNLLDKIGTRKGFSIAIILWSLAAAGHSMARGISGLWIFRFLLGFGEAGNFPACIKTVAEWFPKKERSFATGLFNAGSNIGAILAPVLVAFLLGTYGWEYTFIVTGTLGFLWLFFWLLIYRKPSEHTSLSASEFSYIHSDPAEAEVKIPWIGLLGKRKTWAFAGGKFLTDPVWWIYLTWLPTFFKEQHHIDIKSMIVPMITIYLISDLGSIGGGWLSSHLIKSGWSINKARKLTMLICALCVVPIFFAGFTSNLWVAIALISLATAAHQGWSANLFTMVSDSFPKQATASVTGIGGMSGAIGGMLMAGFGGLIYQNYGPAPLFIISSFAYLVALGVVSYLNPNLDEESN